LTGTLVDDTRDAGLIPEVQGFNSIIGPGGGDMGLDGGSSGGNVPFSPENLSGTEFDSMFAIDDGMQFASERNLWRESSDDSPRDEIGAVQVGQAPLPVRGAADVDEPAGTDCGLFQDWILGIDLILGVD
jgi:hypothetical protein